MTVTCLQAETHTKENIQCQGTFMIRSLFSVAHDMSPLCLHHLHFNFFLLLFFLGGGDGDGGDPPNISK